MSGNDPTTGPDAVVAAALAPVPPLADPEQGVGQDVPPAPPDDGDGAVGPGPEGCPVVPLGIDEDGFRHYVTPSGRLEPMRPDRHGKLNIVALFDGNDGWLGNKFPATDKEGNQTGWNGFAAAKWLLRESAVAGGFSPRNGLRGTGAWRPTRDDGATGLIVHCGDVVLLDGELVSPGRLGTKIYPAKPPLPRPAPAPASRTDGHRLLSYLEAAPWGNAETMPRLALGAIGAGFLPGALKIRPMVHLGGDKGSGKSTILELMEGIEGDWAEMASDVSEAAIRGMLAGGARMLLLDETEPDELRDKAVQIVKLARLSWSDAGGGAARGRADGSYAKTPLKALFVLASVLPPPMTEADTDRFTFLTLQHASPMPNAWRAAQDHLEELKALGPAFHRRMLDSWPRVEALIPRLEKALEDMRHVGRAPANLAVLLACAEVLTSDDRPDMIDIEAVIAPYNPLERDAQVDSRLGWLRCLDKLMTSPGPEWLNGSRLTVAELVREALIDLLQGRVEPDQPQLKRLGLRVLALTGGQAGEHGHAGQIGLAVSNQAEGLVTLFEGSPWAGGGWKTGLRAAPSAFATGDGVRFVGRPERATFVPHELLGLDIPQRGGGSA
jgi:hypothetical protein